jgi:signal transduction histidine kinase
VLSCRDDEELFVEMDRDRLNMLVTHLLRNAQDATPTDGHVDVAVSKEDGFARIEVTDNGCGMDAEFIRDRLFKPFDSTKGAQGMGIGAYQIRETVSAVGGSVTVKSEPGVGTTMIVKLPRLAVRRQGDPGLGAEPFVPPGEVADIANS